MFTVSDLIIAQGGITKFAHLIDQPVQTVAGWKLRGSIPVRHWPRIAEKCPDLGPAELLAVHHGRPPPAALPP